MIIKKPMKAETLKEAHIDNLTYPLYASYKLDGWRCLQLPERGSVTQGFHPIPNVATRDAMNDAMIGSCLDGELVTFDEQGRIKIYNDIQSELSTHAGTPRWRYLVFDCFEYPEMEFIHRLDMAYKKVKEIGLFLPRKDMIEFVTQTMIYTPEDLRRFYACAIEEGYEGIVTRSINGPYKSGRSTLGQEWMLKRKPWEDAEGKIIGFYELMHNENPDERSLHKTAKRSSKKAGMVPGNTLGGFTVMTEEWGEVDVGGGKGLTQALRQEIWENQEKWLGRNIVFKYLAFGMKDKPRHPIYKGLRSE